LTKKHNLLFFSLFALFILLFWLTWFLSGGCTSSVQESLTTSTTSSTTTTTTIGPIAGALDPDFGFGGMVSIEGAKSYGSAVDSSDRIIVVGSSGYYSGGSPSDRTVWRFKTNGNPDDNFGRNGSGMVIEDRLDGIFKLVAVDSQRIVVAGTTADGLAVLSYQLNGDPDNGFNGDGIATVNMSDMGLGGGGFEIKDMHIDPSGKILILSNTVVPENMIIWRFNSNGSLDTTFDGKGYLIYSENNKDSVGNSITVASPDRIFVAGYSNLLGNPKKMTVWKFLSNGSPEAKKVFSTPEDSYGDKVLIDSDGRVIVIGYNSSLTWSPLSGPNRIDVWRYSSDLDPDITFNSTGRVEFNGMGDAGGAIDSFGNIIIAGGVGNIIIEGELIKFKLVIWRYKSDGTPDTDFGNGTGQVSYSMDSFNLANYDKLDGPPMMLDSSGRLIFAARVKGTVNKMIIFRFK